jgi:hypothetical protein
MSSFLNIVDKHLDAWITKGLNKLPIKSIQPEMSAPSEDPTVEWKTWLPIDSKVTDAELDEIETAIGYKLSDSYRKFLKHKHFYNLHIGEASFCRHAVNEWRSSQMANIFDSWPREFLIDKGYLPFADWSDWGMLCFDTSQRNNNNEYPIVQWDHERFDEFTPFATDFISLIHSLDKQTGNEET